jgi:hypothetical protein
MASVRHSRSQLGAERHARGKFVLIAGAARKIVGITSEHEKMLEIEARYRDLRVHELNTGWAGRGRGKDLSAKRM